MLKPLLDWLARQQGSRREIAIALPIAVLVAPLLWVMLMWPSYTESAKPIPPATYSLGGDSSQFLTVPKEAGEGLIGWTVVVAAKTVELDWDSLVGANVSADLLVRVTGPVPASQGRARIWNVTDRAAVAESAPVLAGDSPQRVTLPISAGRGRKVYRLEQIADSAQSAVSTTGDIVVQR